MSRSARPAWQRFRTTSFGRISSRPIDGSLRCHRQAIEEKASPIREMAVGERATFLFPRAGMPSVRAHEPAPYFLNAHNVPVRVSVIVLEPSHEPEIVPPLL
jgi:hypothetical protein